MNALAPAAEALTAELTRDAEGRHTTTTARWYQLDATSAIIDAPGVRDFAPPAHLVRAAERGFVEIHALSVQCRFKDCRHMEEPGCAVRTRRDQSTDLGAPLRKLPAVVSSIPKPGLLRLHTHLRDSSASGEGMRQGTAIDVLQLAADRHAVRNSRRLQP